MPKKSLKKTSSQSRSKTHHRLELKRLDKLLVFEKQAFGKGFDHLAGVDEAGRGPLAGPVVAAACVIAEGVLFEGVNDSKLLTPKRRRALYEQLTGHEAVRYGIGIVDSEEIDRINIYQATIRAMHLALDALGDPVDCLLVDAIMLSYRDLPCEKVIHGDRRSHTIAAASILAKCTRDCLMEEYDRQFPAYGFGQHKGYGTLAHREALEKYGPCPIHRKSFACRPISNSLK